MVPKVPTNRQLDERKDHHRKRTLSTPDKILENRSNTESQNQRPPTTTINAMESQEEYDKEVQELYDRIQQQMDQEIIEAKKR